MYGRATPNATSRRLGDWPRGDCGASGNVARLAARPVLPGHPGRRLDSVGPRVSGAEPARLPGVAAGRPIPTTRHSVSVRPRPRCGRAASTFRWCRSATAAAPIQDLSRREREWLASDRRAELLRAIELLGLGDPIHWGCPTATSATASPNWKRNAQICPGRAQGDVVCRDMAGRRTPRPRSGRARGSRCRRRTGAELLEYPIWMWHWAVPDDDAVPWQRMSRVRLDRAAVARKQAAATVFRTQLTRTNPDRTPCSRRS